ncbi:hypothetical protein CC85DRAFT_282483 [Cutaneotrichosporon oleaginosum]|uniref:Ubiquitin conjugation factor E4 core domain-containing protein n=1 Tax=Cutaneotrichosporon oleaginosum TaxID=879819 RepID=A0A0J0XWH8_9TREE|nr:uncharacterized protein CC85DRAFT_282483 [Cutaneotrichosporon oleaginosum]KLT45417.1 hypothetical protein CC85DRAFT_282483 [Cutaneotrichosporon oleaginosum]TXT14620.1 hypothetical protein COLE_00813 [Cutaneotrichosporon oleaginosum]
MSGNDQELSEAEKMRLKRLARLGGPAPAVPPPSASSSVSPANQVQGAGASSSASRLLSSSNLNEGAPPRSASPASSPRTPPQPPRAQPKPAHQRPAIPVPKKSSPAISRTATPSSRFTAPSPAALLAPSMPYSQWESHTVASVFSVTLKKATAEKSDWKLCWLKSLAQEIAEESPGDASKLTASLDVRDRLLIARLSLDPNDMATSDDPDQLQVLAGLPQNETVFEYLTGCWKRLYAANREMLRFSYSAAEKAQWAYAFDELKRLIISYAGMTLEDPSMFPQPAARRDVGPAEFLPLLLGVGDSEDSNPGDPYTSSTAERLVIHQGALQPSDLLPFLNDLVAGFPDGSFADVITPTLSLFFQKWFQISPQPDLLGNDWRKYIGAMSTLVQVKGIAALLPSLPVWVAPNVQGSTLEWKSLLGPLTRLSVFPREFPEIWKTYFSNPTDRKVADIDANKANLRHTLGGLQTSLFNIYNAIVRASPEAREGVLNYFTLVCKVNQKRAGMRVDYRTVSTDGFMINVHAVLLKLFEPVMDVQYSKIDKVDTDYYIHSDRLDISDETKIRATKEEAERYFDGAMKTDTKANFISDLFYLLNSIFHLGLCKTIDTRSKAEKNIQQMEDELKKLEAQQAAVVTNPTARAQGEAGITKLKADIATLHASIHAYDTQLLDPAFTRLNVTFCGFVMTWMLRLVDPKHQHPQTSISLPLPAEAPIQFKMLPEFILENIVEYYLFLSRYNPDALDKADKDILIAFALTFVSPTYVNNPFLKAKLINALANGLYPVGYWRRGPLFDQLSVLPLSTEHLMPTLIRFFIDVEMTGGHTQFWDKFSFRRDISRIIKSMWSNPLHREAFVKSARDDEDQFIRFVNMLMSDTTFHLEESLTQLAKIHSLRARKEDAESWNALPENERNDLDSQLRQSESSAPFHTAMGRDHAELMRDFTATTKEPFLVGEIVDRLAASLDENLTNLVGPKMQELKLVDPERFSFKPKQLLAAIAQIYLNLGDSRPFINAVAIDGRSYSRELFERFARVLKNRAIMTDGEVAGIVAFTQRVEDAKATIEAEEEREIPDEFLDPLMATRTLIWGVV